MKNAFHFPQKLVMVTLWFAISSAQAEAAITLTISNRTYVNPALQVASDAAADSIESQFNSLLSSSGTDSFLTEMGNANAGATRSLLSPGVISDSRYSASYSIHGSFSGGMSATSSANSLPAVGLGAHSGITVGANGELIKIFRGLDPKRVMYYLSFGTLDVGSYFPSSNITTSALQFSAGVSYLLSNPRPWIPGFRFNGIRVTSGLSYGSFSLGYTTPFTSSSGGVSMTSDVTMTVDSKIYTFSNEATVGFRTLYVVDLYTGLGVDFTFGSTTLTGSNSNGSVTATSGASTVFTGSAVVSGDTGSYAPSVAQLRYILGTQVNLGPLAVFTQVQASTPSVYSLNLGAKFTF